MLHTTKPADFKPLFDVVACVLESDGDILLLHRQDHKTQGNTWGVPAGKVEKGESFETALEREIFQETGFSLKTSEAAPKLFRTFYVRYPDYDFVYHKYHLILPVRPDIVISSDEHKDFRWVTPAQALTMNLIPDEPECLKALYSL